MLYNSKLSSDEEAVVSNVKVFDACKLIFGKSTAISRDSTCKAVFSFGLLVPIVCPKVQNDVKKKSTDEMKIQFHKKSVIVVNYKTGYISLARGKRISKLSHYRHEHKISFLENYCNALTNYEFSELK